MNEVDIEFSRRAHYVSRGGFFQSSGIKMMKKATISGDNIVLYPITTRGKIGNCDIEIPVEDLNVVIDHLIKLKKSYET